MIPFPIMNTYGNRAKGWDEGNPNKLNGTVSTLSTQSSFSTYGTRMTSYHNNIYAINAGSEIYSLNPSNDSFVKITTRPVQARNNGICCDLNNIYVAGGYPATNSFNRYNISTSTWSTLAVLPTALYSTMIAINYDLGDYLYLIENNRFWRYNISSNTWETNVLAALPFTANGDTDEGGMIYSTGYIWYAYGVNFARYNISTNAWEVLASSTMSGRCKISRMGNYIYAVCTVSGLWQYTISTNTWVKLNASAPVVPNLYEPGIACSYANAYVISNSTLYKIS